MLDFSDLLIVTGAGLMLAGSWLIYPPVALIAAGVLLLAAGLARASNSRPGGDR